MRWYLFFCGFQRFFCFSKSPSSSLAILLVKSSLLHIFTKKEKSQISLLFLYFSFFISQALWGFSAEFLAFRSHWVLESEFFWYLPCFQKARDVNAYVEHPILRLLVEFSCFTLIYPKRAQSSEQQERALVHNQQELQQNNQLQPWEQVGYALC